MPPGLMVNPCCWAFVPGHFFLCVFFLDVFPCALDAELCMLCCFVACAQQRFHDIAGRARQMQQGLARFLSKSPQERVTEAEWLDAKFQELKARDKNRVLPEWWRHLVDWHRAPDMQMPPFEKWWDPLHRSIAEARWALPLFFFLQSLVPPLVAPSPFNPPPPGRKQWSSSFPRAVRRSSPRCC